MYSRIALPILAVGLYACSSDSPGSLDANQIVQAPFPDTIDPIPDNWNDFTRYPFKLSQAYPESLPANEPAPWISYSPTDSVDEYMLAVRDYCFGGFVHQDDPEMDFRPEFNSERNWFHMPWMHTTTSGREWIRGLTRERDAGFRKNEAGQNVGQLAETQTKPYQDWGIGFYNPPGGYAIGQVWKDHDNPNPAPESLLANGAQGIFPTGSVVFKMLFSQADPSEVPWLQYSPAWTANIHTKLGGDKGATSRDDVGVRSPQTVRLAQMDIAVKDPRAERTGWVYGTFVFDESKVMCSELVPDCEEKFGAYAHMIPVGIAWGNDEGVPVGEPLSETLLSENIPEVAKHTLGHGGRLNGPGDNPSSACVSCHQTAQWEPLSGMAPSSRATDEERLPYFRTLAQGEAFDAGQVSLDTSLQMQISLVNYACGSPDFADKSYCRLR